MGVGMPAALKLHEFGSQVWAAFGHMPYHVGSSLAKKVFRDVDVRLLLPDDEWKAMFGKDADPARMHSNGKWVALVLAFTALGKEMTGLNIDFQIQPTTWANHAFEFGPRSALGVTPTRMAK